MSPKPFRLVAVFAIMISLWSCTKENVSAPAVQQSSLSSDDAVQPGETVVQQLVPGLYSILRFIDTGNDETAQFNGYSFDFQANGDLVATTGGGQTFTGSWRLNAAQTRMALTITGTPALDDLDDDNWRVVVNTTERLSLRKQGPDRVVFVLQ